MQCDHLNFPDVSHGRFLPVLAEETIDQAHAGKLCTSEKPSCLRVAMKQVYQSSILHSSMLKKSQLVCALITGFEMGLAQKVGTTSPELMTLCPRIFQFVTVEKTIKFEVLD